jgi:hypothetical protein
VAMPFSPVFNDGDSILGGPLVRGQKAPTLAAPAGSLSRSQPQDCLTAKECAAIRALRFAVHRERHMRVNATEYLFAVNTRTRRRWPSVQAKSLRLRYVALSMTSKTSAPSQRRSRRLARRDHVGPCGRRGRRPTRASGHSGSQPTPIVFSVGDPVEIGLVASQ